MQNHHLPNQPFNQYSQLNENNQKIEVEIASAGERIAAYIINNILTIASILVPIIIFLISAPEISADSDFRLTTGVIISCFIPIVYCIIQIFYMSRDGQSIGKKLLRLKVIKNDGSNTGFIGVVLIREVVFNVLCSIVLAIFAFIVGILFLSSSNNSTNNTIAELISSSLQLLPMLICLIMLFTAKDKRTLQDLLANTVVVKLPRK